MSEEQSKTVEEAIETVLGDESVEQAAEAPEQAQESEAVDAQAALIEELTKKLAAAEEALKEQKDEALRAKAWAQNEVRKAGIDAESRRKSVLKTFANALTPVVDHLELAIQHADKDNEVIKPMLDGVDMTRTELIKALAGIGIKQIDPMGEALNPEKHQAMSMQVVEGTPANQVVAVMQKGYELDGGQVIRPAMVVVSKDA